MMASESCPAWALDSRQGPDHKNCPSPSQELGQNSYFSKGPRKGSESFWTAVVSYNSCVLRNNLHLGRCMGEKSVCKICHRRFKVLTESHAKTHGLTLSEYRCLFSIDSDSQTKCKFYDGETNQRCELTTKEQFCILHSHDRSKNQSLFNHALSVVLNQALSSKSEIHLEGVHFPSTFVLSDQIIENSAYFTSGHFYGKVKIDATFNNKVDFKNCIFEDDCDFQGVKFLSTVSFIDSNFRKTANFKRARFFEKATFWRARFEGEANFGAAIFGAEVRFVTCDFPRHPFYVDFMVAKFETPNTVIFSGVDFSRALFRWSDLSSIRFENVKWPTTSRIRGARHYLADEFYSWVDRKENRKYPPEQHYDYVQDLYQQLKRNYEESRSYTEAGDFYYGEMECYRKARPTRRYLPTWQNLYRLSSGYGQRYIRAGAILLLLLLVFAVSHMFIGLETTSRNSKYHDIEYSAATYAGNLKSFLIDLGVTTVYCIEVLTRQEKQDRLFQPLSIAGEALNVTLSMVVYVQVLFFVLALRRHFKR